MNPVTPKELLTHEIKCTADFFEEVLTRAKPFELRIFDRKYGKGDTLVLKEINGAAGEFTGREATFIISYILEHFKGLAPGWCILGLQDPNDLTNDEKAYVAHILYEIGGGREIWIADKLMSFHA